MTADARPAAPPARPVPRQSWRQRAGQTIDTARTLIVLVWASVVVPRLVQTLTAAKFRSTLDDAPPASSAALWLDRAFTAALLIGCLIVVARRSGQLPTRRRGALLALLAPWAYLVLRDLYLDELPIHGDHLVYPALVIALWALQPPLQRLSVLGYLTGLVAVLSVALAAALPGKGLYRAASGVLIVPDKQLLPLGVLVGPFTDSNNLGQVLVLGFPAILLVPHRAVRAALAAATAFAIVWTSSRSSVAALVVAVLAWLCLRLVGNSAGRRAGMSATFLLVLTSVMVVLPFTAGNDTSFTNRGAVWIGSLHGWRSDPVFGLGSRWYASIAPYLDGLGPYAFHGHNQFVQTIVVGGLINVVLVGVLLVVLCRAACGWAARGVDYPVVFLATLLVSCTLEVSVGFVDRGFLLAVTCLPAAVILFSPAGLQGTMPAVARPLVTGRRPSPLSVHRGSTGRPALR